MGVSVVKSTSFSGHDDVDAVPGPHHLIGHAQKGVGVGRKIDPENVCLLVQCIIDETVVLMAEAVIILVSDMAGQEVVQRRDQAMSVYRTVLVAELGSVPN